MLRKINQLEAVATIDIDIGKNAFHLVGFDRKGAIALRQKLSRSQVSRPGSRTCRPASSAWRPASEHIISAARTATTRG
jgi:hypothetical protein